ncbi:MAG TPA: GAF domain-containing protein [Kineosporiaceae bacterium]|nr:GAF domain-containing protein [Kineosporiaceae bacterium]
MGSLVPPIQRLAELLAAVSQAGTSTAGAQVLVERTAQVLDADVAAMLCHDEVVAAVGRPGVAVALVDVRPGAGAVRREAPGLGAVTCQAVSLDHPPGATLVVGRSDGRVLTGVEAEMLSSIAVAGAGVLRTLATPDERVDREAGRSVRTIADEQAALRRVATLVARGEPPAVVFAAVAEEVGQVLEDVDFALVARYDAVGVEVVGGWSRAGRADLVGRRDPVGGANVSTLVFERAEPARVDWLTDREGAVSRAALDLGIRSSAGAPITVEGRLWGVMIVASRREESLPEGIEHRLADFSELAAIAIANTQARIDVRTLADEQAALRHVATLVARGEPPTAVFRTIAEEVGRLFPVDLTLIGRYDGGQTILGVAGWQRSGATVPPSTARLGGRNVTTIAFETGRPARLDTYSSSSGGAAEDARTRGLGSSVGVPITVQGRIWGIVVAGSTQEHALPPGLEQRLARFTELAGTAIANAEARDELQRVAEEHAALRRVATLVARAVPPEVLFHTVTEEVGRVVDGTDGVVLIRYDPDGFATTVGMWSRAGALIPIGTRVRPGGRNISTLVYQTGRPVRLDALGDDAGADARRWGQATGLLSGVGAPINVGGRLWGVMLAAASKEHVLPADVETRLVEFTELVATAIANAEAQAELRASRARVVATADETRRRIERDLHDGAQQQLVSLLLRVRAMEAGLQADLYETQQDLDDIGRGLTAAIEELREISRGIHPAQLAEGGLAVALRSLSRRSPIPVQLGVNVPQNLSWPVKVTAYYVVSEALTNAAKHANASVVDVAVELAERGLRVDVRDDGVGGAELGRGSGLVGLKDRVEAIGGRLVVASPPGEGTRLTAELPLDPG